MTENQLDLYINGKLIVISRSLCNVEARIQYSFKRWLTIFDFEGKNVHVLWCIEDEIRKFVLKGSTLYEMSRTPVLLAA